MTNARKIVFFSTFIAVLLTIVFSAEPSFAQGGDPSISESCSEYPGFINKIVKCITHIVEREAVEGLIERVHEIFVQVSNVAIVLYIMFFGLKLMLGGVENVKAEIFIVSITSVMILYMNNTTKIMDTLDLFILGQAEFANAATAAITTSPVQNGTSTELICVGPYEENTSGNLIPITDPVTGERQLFSTWQRVDCIIGYILGAHPLFERTEQYFETTETEEDDNNPIRGEAQRFDYEMFASDKNPFANMAEEPFAFLKGPDAKVTENYESFLSFSMLTIMVGMLFSEGMGIIVMLTGLFIIFLMIAAFGQAVLVYLTALFAMVVLAMFAPVIIPMFLFRFTRRIFDFWLQMFFTYMLQPGIMLAYLSFMIFVLQYVLEYSGDGIDSKNLIEYHFGEIYKNAKKQQKTLIQKTTTADSVIEENSDNLRDISEKLGNVFSDFSDSDTWVINSKVGNDAENEREGKRGVAERGNPLNTLFKSFSDTSANTSGADNSSFSLYNFKFDCEDNADTQQRLLNYISTQPNVSPTELLRSLHNNQAFLEELSNAEGEREKCNYTHAVSYMQVLLVVFLTMSVTFAFMQNVMAFGSEMAGAGTLPVNQMVNIYNSYTGKMAKSLK